MEQCYVSGPNAAVEHPDYLALKEEAARLQAELTALLLQKDELEQITCRRIESAYLRRFGALELKHYEAYCECLRAKKRTAMIRAEVNRRQRPDEDRIEQELDRQLEEHRKALEQKMEQVMSAVTPRKGPGLSESGRKELKRLYRQAVKNLHPDLHPEADEADRRKLDRAIRAYRAGDLRTLRAVCETSARSTEESAAEEEISSLDLLRQKVRNLRAGVKFFNRELERIKQQYPYTMRVYLEDEEQAKAKQKELEQQILLFRGKTKAYADAAEQMLQAEEADL